MTKLNISAGLADQLRALGKESCVLYAEGHVFARAWWILEAVVGHERSLQYGYVYLDGDLICGWGVVTHVDGAPSNQASISSVHDQIMSPTRDPWLYNLIGFPEKL